MKHALVALLAICISSTAMAQKDIFWADGGVSLARFVPGASVTYNYKIARFLALGAGAQIYDFHATKVNYQPIPALYWDARFNLSPKKKSQYFLFMDAGLNIYKSKGQYWIDGANQYTMKDDNGTYTGFGIGYFRPQTARGWGHYATVKLISNSYNAKEYNSVSGTTVTKGWGDATFVVSFGYRF